MELKQLKIGFIGFGNMGQAMARGWINKGGLDPAKISASARDFEKLKKISGDMGIRAFESSREVVEQSELIILAVKPHQIEEVVKPLKDLFQGKVILSVAAGYTFEMFEKILPESMSHISTIPNTPVSIGEGVIIAEKTHSLTDIQETVIIELLEKLGLVEFVETDQMSMAGTLAGCGPAFASMFIEALADGAVKYGLSRKEAYRLASQMIAGTGKMQIETNEHPGAMKDAVTSPGGTTIKGVSALEKNGFRGAVISAIDAIEGT